MRCDERYHHDDKPRVDGRNRDPAHLSHWRTHGLRTDKFSGARGARTLGLCHAMAALSQLSYSPKADHRTVLIANCPSRSGSVARVSQYRSIGLPSS